MQTNNYLESVKLESGDLRPIARYRKRVPRRKSREKFIEDLKVWLKIVETNTAKNPLYTPIITITKTI